MDGISYFLKIQEINKFSVLTAKTTLSALKNLKTLSQKGFSSYVCNAFLKKRASYNTLCDHELESGTNLGSLGCLQDVLFKWLQDKEDDLKSGKNKVCT